MGRPAKHRICEPHPSPRFRDKVRLFNFLRGPDDEGWAAQYLINGVWMPRNPAALGTRDWDEACERARDRYNVAAAGQPIVKLRATANTKVHEHAFRRYAEPVIARLHQTAIDEDAKVKGKGHTFYAAARQIERDLLPRWSDTPITAITEADLNDWVADEFRVEDVAATVAKYGSQPKDKVRQVVWKKPAVTTLGNLDRAFNFVWQEAVAAKVVDRRRRPTIRKHEHGEEGESRAFIDAIGVQAVARVMTDLWVNTPQRSRHRHEADAALLFGADRLHRHASWSGSPADQDRKRRLSDAERLSGDYRSRDQTPGEASQCARRGGL